MSESAKVNCSSHGWQEESFVCQHIVQSLSTGYPTGFHWPAGSTQRFPDAWCSSCEAAREAAGGEWTPEVEKKLNIQLLCGACYERAKGIWSNRSRESQ